jgi:hypothetical protein
LGKYYHQDQGSPSKSLLLERRHYKEHGEIETLEVEKEKK